MITSSLALVLALLAPQESPLSLDREVALRRAHYANVEAELLAADTSGLSAAQRARRAEAIEALRAYRERGEFGVGPDADRDMVFVDDGGRRCAVAHLLHHFGEDELVDEIAAWRNDGFVQELLVNQRLVDALASLGLTADEAARIQVPGTRPRGDDDLGGARSPVAWPPRPAPVGPSTPTSPTTPRAPSSPGSIPSGRGGASTTGPSAPATPSAPADVPVAWDDWWTWWEYNKLEWLVAPRDAQPLVDDGRTRSVSYDRERVACLELLRDAIASDDAVIRQTAVVALARIAGGSAREAVLDVLDDASMTVRQHAILALGALDDDLAVYDLLRIAHTGGLEGRARIEADAEPLAIVALGLARARGIGSASDAMLPRSSDERIEDARAMQPFLAESPALAADLRRASGLFDGDRPARKIEDANERALESLRFDASEETLAALLHALGARDAEVRRSTAATLGRFQHPGALAPLMTAFEVEREPFTRSLLLIALGRQGGEQARRFLGRELARGKNAQRPWCALALGVLARHEGDPTAVEPLLEAYRDERDADARGAYLIALGLGGLERAESLLLEELRGSNAVSRSMAALGLGMLATPAAVEALRDELAKVEDPFGRSSLAQGLALARSDEDAAALVDAMRRIRVLEERTQIAAAAAFHGSRALVPALGELAADESAAPLARSAAIQALGMLFDDVEPFRMAALSRDANHAVFPAWIDAPLQSTL